MTQDELGALLQEADAKKDGDWMVAGEGRKLTFYAAKDGVSLTVAAAEAVNADGGMLKVRTTRGEIYVLALADVFAGATEGTPNTVRKAGFAS